MANQLVGFTLRATSDSDDVVKLGVWGDIAPDMYDDFETILNTASVVAITGQKVIGKIDKYADSNAQTEIDAIPVTELKDKMLKGDLILKREGKGAVFFKGKFPMDQTVLMDILKQFVTGSGTVGGAQVKEVIPRLNILQAIKRV